MTKNELRKQIRRKSLALTDNEQQRASAAVFGQIEQMPRFTTAHTVALFCALADELPTAALFDRWAQTKRMVIPRVEGDVMQYYEYDPTRLIRGAFGIFEPASDARLCPPTEIDLMIAPGVAFTAEGARLGRGRGYYDKYLSQTDFHAFKIGVGYAHQLLTELPTEPHDVWMDLVVAR